MSIARTLLRPVAHIGSLHAGRQISAFLRAHQRTRIVQNRLLTELIRHHGGTDFGRDHGFTRIRSYEDFTSAVPVGSYETLRPYIDRVIAGQTGALFPPHHRVLMFSLTSGTTGQPKHIPVTSRFLTEMRRGWNIFGLSALRDHPDAWLRPILQISSPIQETLSPTGLPCGAISGLLAQTQKRIVRQMYVVPPAVATIPDPLAKYYTTLRCAIQRNVALITTANPSSTIRLIEVGQAHCEQLIRDIADGTLTPPGPPGEHAAALQFRPNPKLARRLSQGVQRDGVLLPRHFWNVSFLANWTGGTLKLYIPRLRELFGDVPIRDIGLLASEGRFSMPMADDTAGLAEITANVLEFIPDSEYGSDNPPALRADEVEIGGEYTLVVTNWAGLWRYNMDDRVRVVDKLGQSPLLEFLSRGKHTANITGEKITEHQVVEAMRLASARARMEVHRFVMQGRFAQTPHYELRLESPTTSKARHLARCMDDALGKLNVEYHSKRDSGRLGSIRPIILTPGTLERTEAQNIQQRNGRSEQYKHQYLMTEVLKEQTETSTSE